MGKDQSKNKDRLIEILIVAFAVVTLGLLAAQLVMNVAETLDSAQANETPAPALGTPVPQDTPRPAPTYRFDQDTHQDA